LTHMATILEVDQPGHLEFVDVLIHDCYFDIERIEADRDARRLIIPFEGDERHRKQTRLRSGDQPPHAALVQCLLAIHNLRHYEIQDTEQVRFYNFNYLEYDPDKRRIRVATGIPISIHADVESLRVSVEITDEPGGASK